MLSTTVVNSGGGTTTAAASVASSSSPDPTFKTRGTSGTVATASTTTAGRSSIGSHSNASTHTHGMMNVPIHNRQHYYFFDHDRSRNGGAASKGPGSDSNSSSYSSDVYGTPYRQTRPRAKTPATNNTQHSNLHTLDVSMEDQYTDRVLQNSDVLALKLFDPRMNPLDPQYRLSAHVENDEDNDTVSHATNRGHDDEEEEEEYDFGDNTTLSHSEMIKEDRSFFFFSATESTSDPRDFDGATLASSEYGNPSDLGDATVGAVRGVDKQRDEDIYDEEYLEQLPPQRSPSTDNLRTRAALVKARKLKGSPTIFPYTNNYFHYYHEEQRQQLLHPTQRHKGVAVQVYESAKGFWFWSKSHAQHNSRALSISPAKLLFYSPLGFVMGVSEEVCSTVAKMVGVEDLEKDVVHPQLTMVDDKVLNPVTNILSNTFSSWISPFWFAAGTGLGSSADAEEKPHSDGEARKIIQITLPESFPRGDSNATDVHPGFDVREYEQHQGRVLFHDDGVAAQVDDGHDDLPRRSSSSIHVGKISPEVAENMVNGDHLSDKSFSDDDDDDDDGEEAPDDFDDHESDRYLYRPTKDQGTSEKKAIHVVEQQVEDDKHQEKEEGKHIFVHRGIVYESTTDDFGEEHEGAWIPLEDAPTSSCISS